MHVVFVASLPEKTVASDVHYIDMDVCILKQVYLVTFTVTKGFFFSHIWIYRDSILHSEACSLFLKKQGNLTKPIYQSEH